MRAYNETWVRNRAVVQQAEQWHRQRLLTDVQIDAVRRSFPFEFRQTNGFLEVGLFLFTVVAILSCYLLPATAIGSLLDDRTTSGLFNIGSGIAIGLVGRLLINRRQLYRNGVDNAFVVMLTGFLAFGFNQFLPTDLTIATYCLLTLPLLLLVLWYYGDTLIAFIALATFYTFVFDGMLQFSWGKAALPFVMMAVSGGLFITVQQIGKSPYYADALNLAQWVALIVLAAAGNYFVVRELNGLLLDPAPGQLVPVDAPWSGIPEIALPGLFWFLTFAIPAAYLQQGLSRKNRMLIILGGLGLIAAVITVHEYTGLLPLNVALTLGGLVLIGLAVIIIRFLRQPITAEERVLSYRNGFTDDPDYESPDQFFVNVGTAVAMQATTGAQQQPKEGVQFGGGHFGGGGSEGKY
ncbi:hypothetical protein [Spirosoma arcticum]